jgi:ribonuclease T1
MLAQSPPQLPHPSPQRRTSAPSPQRRTSAAAGAFLCVALVLGAPPLAAKTAATDAAIARDTLPPEARETLALIHQGGPFRYDRDGIVFGNREKLLPAKPRSYYHEYTVGTPGVKTRGARRIICGGPEKAPDACWYTQDHYQSFMRIRE